MKLTKKKAVEISIELWTWLAETGKEKWDWEGWEKYGHMYSDCALCEYDMQRSAVNMAECVHCPYYLKFLHCDGESTLYREWADAETGCTRKKYAQLFLEQLLQL